MNTDQHSQPLDMIGITFEDTVDNLK